MRSVRVAEVPSLPLLTCGVLGAQCVWAIETAFGAPFLLHLGLPKSQMAIVFIAGPLSGLLVQPCIGLISDASTSAWGRRRPLLVASCCVCLPSILVLGFARPIATIFTGSDDLTSQSQWTLAIGCASIWLIDFSVNAVQALDRALVLDLVPTHTQALANAWSARLSGLGAIVGFSISQTDMTLVAPFRWFPSITAGDATEAQLRCVCVFVAVLLGLTHAVTIGVAKEMPATKNTNGPHVSTSFIHGIRQIVVELIATAKSLSRPMIHLFRVQLFLQSAWYPIIFFSTTWIAQIATAQLSIDNAAALRLGSKAFLMHAILSITCTLTLPIALHAYVTRHPQRTHDSLALLLSIATFVLSIALFSTRFISSAGNVSAAMTMVTLAGFPWALNIWAPSALIAIMIRKESETQRDMHLLPTSAQGVHEASATGPNEEERHTLMRHRERDEGDIDEEDEAEEAALRDELRTTESWNGGTPGDEPLRGATILGLLNVSIVLPQFLMTLISTILFSAMENVGDGQEQKASSSGGVDELGVGSSDAIGLVFQIGGLSALLAAVLIYRMSKEHFQALAG